MPRRGDRRPFVILNYAEREAKYMKAPAGDVNRVIRQTLSKEKSLVRAMEPRILQSTMYGRQRDDYAKGLSSIIRQLSADHVEVKAAKKAVQTLRDVLNRIPGLTVSRDHKGGSFGRRTHVPDCFDVDTIMFIKTFNHRALRYPDDWQDETLMLDMRRQVAKYLRANTRWDIRIPEDAHYRYVLQMMVEGVEVDLLLVPDCLDKDSENADWDQHKLLMAPVYSNPEASTYVQLRERADSAALTKFLDAHSEGVRGVVRLVKAWYKLGVCGGLEPESRIGSIALEVLVLAAAERLGGGEADAEEDVPQSARRRGKVPGNTYKLDLFEETLQLIDEVVTRGAVAMVDAGNWGYPREVGALCAHNWACDDIIIIHPIDPTCNLARARVHKGPPDWQGLAQEAREMLGIMRTGTFQDLLQRSNLALVLLQTSLTRRNKSLASLRGLELRQHEGKGKGKGPKR